MRTDNSKGRGLIGYTCDRRSFLSAAASAFALTAATPIAWAQAAKPLKIGVLTDISSLYADVTGKGSVVATQMAAEDFSASGKSLKVEILSADHQNKADVAASIARKWIDQEGVDVIVDVPNSAVALAVGNIVREKNKVMLASGPSSSDLTGKACSPNTIHWTYDTYALATGAATAVVQSGGKTWFTLTADYAFGHAMEQDVKNVVARNGGKVIGGVRAPLNTQDFSSFLLQAQSSQAEVIGLINAGGDTINSIKQAVEFGITSGGQRLVATVLYITDVHSLGLEVAQGLQFTEAFYWDLNDDTRAWTKRFAPRNDGRYPSALHAGAYASVLHYLRAVDAAGGSADGAAVVAKMKELPTDDPLFGKGSIRVDGRKIHPMYLFQVKTPAESKYPWDYYNVVKTIPAEQVWRPLNEGGCSLVKL
ncbi:ABC transporter substrate-binding protein [Chelatococcus sp. GCM10030263]|uniref:ABC transporter substrate-binding protein n=1 Tax=Chelatococcus sp. GCM10030263 TaxID=3273387 RepID=UPI003615EE1D